VFKGFFGKLWFRYLLRLKISLALSDEHDEKLTRPTSVLTRKFYTSRQVDFLGLCTNDE